MNPTADRSVRVQVRFFPSLSRDSRDGDDETPRQFVAFLLKRNYRHSVRPCDVTRHVINPRDVGLCKLLLLLLPLFTVPATRNISKTKRDTSNENNIAATVFRIIVFRSMESIFSPGCLIYTSFDSLNHSNIPVGHKLIPSFPRHSR